MRENIREFRHENGELAVIKYVPIVCVDNIEVAYVLTKQNIGLAIPPRFLCESDVKLGEMHEVLPDWSLEPPEVYVTWPANIPTSSAAYKLIDYVYNAMEQHKL